MALIRILSHQPAKQTIYPHTHTQTTLLCCDYTEIMMSSSVRQRSPELSRFEQNHDESLSSGNLDIKRGRSKSIMRDSFKCSMACLYMPGFYKRKSMLPLPRSAQQTPESTIVSGTTGISMALSLERNECSSSSSGIVFNLMSDEDEEGWRSPYYDLPVELIRKSIDAESPINAAFVFDCQPKRNIKGKRPSSLAPSMSLYANKSRNPELAWVPSSCPASPSSGPCNDLRLSKAFPIEEILISSASIDVRKHSN